MEILNDFDTSVRKSLSEIDNKWEHYPGLVVCGTHSPSKEKMKSHLQKLTLARERNIPALGICWGFQVMVIEYLKNVIGETNRATTQELENQPDAIVKDTGKLHVGLFGNESYWHKFGVRKEDFIGLPFQDFHSQFLDWEGGEWVKSIQHKHHPFYVGVQYHPEYQSSATRPHPTLFLFLRAVRNHGI
jgi:CTP synthase